MSLIDADFFSESLKSHLWDYENKFCISGIIGVVKAGAYGHGSVRISEHLKAIGVERLAVATTDEAIYLRNHAISGPLHVLGM